MKWDMEQKLISNLIDVYGSFLKSDILHLRTIGELVEGSNRWRISDEEKNIEYTIEVTIKKEKLKK